MIVALDSHYTIGKTHLYCQDYAVHGWEPLPHAILADGCSASPNSDLGARLLVLNARRELARFARIAGGEAERAARHWRLGQRVVYRAARQARELSLNPEALDATLLVAWCDGTAVHVHLYGDGCIATRRADGGLAVIQVEYAENAPYYLSYLLDAERNALYEEAVGDPTVAQSVRYVSEASGISSWRKRFDTPVIFAFDLATFPVVAVATDGFQSVLNTETGAWVEVLDVARALLNFRAGAGAFVRDRVETALREFGNRFQFNLDDLSLGAFVKVD